MGLRSRFSACGVLAVVLLFAALAAPALGAQQREARVSAAVRAQMAKYEIPGVILGVWQRGEAPIVKAFGARNVDLRAEKRGAPMKPNLYMRIGSETKTFTATAVLQLVEAGKVRLDDPISKYVDGVPNGGKITVRELAEMRSGLVNFDENKTWVGEFLENPEREWKPSELLAASYALPPRFAPGEDFEYSNTNYILLGLLVEAVSGEPVGAYIRRHVLAPLHLNHTLFPRGTEFPKPRADGYTVQTANGEVADSSGWSSSWAWSAGAMISNLHDLRIWAKAVATGTLLKPAIQRQRERFIPIPGLKPARYGLGLFEVNGWIGHDGEVPGYESLTVYLPSREATMVILANADVEPNISVRLGRAVSRIVTPERVFGFGSVAPLR